MSETNGNGYRIKVDFNTVLGWILTAIIAWSVVNSRVSVLESQQQEFKRRLDRIESKLDYLVDRSQ